MEQRYLPSTPQQRLQDLMKEHKITQAVLAKKIGVTESTLSRFINGTKDTLSLDQMISIARIFNVSTDFLLCMTDVPDRKNYDISELGLSAEAARNLYTGRTNPQVVSRLLENRRFAQLTNMIALYFDDTLASGFAVQNQIVQTLSSMLLGTGKEQPDARKAAQQAAQTALLNKVPVYQADLTNMHHGGYNGFRGLVLSDKLQRFIEEFLDISPFLALEKLRACGDQNFYHTNTVGASAASGCGNLPFGLCPVLSFRLNKVEIQMAPAGVNIWIACVLFLGALIMGFNTPDLRPLILGKSQNSKLSFFHYFSRPFCHTMS